MAHLSGRGVVFEFWGFASISGKKPPICAARPRCPLGFAMANLIKVGTVGTEQCEKRRWRWEWWVLWCFISSYLCIKPGVTCFVRVYTTRMELDIHIEMQFSFFRVSKFHNSLTPPSVTLGWFQTSLPMAGVFSGFLCSQAVGSP